MNMNKLRDWMDFANRYSEGDFWKQALEGKDNSEPAESPNPSDAQWVPAVDVINSMNETFVLIELPGIRKEDFELY
jgi:HSP20 family protein